MLHGRSTPAGGRAAQNPARQKFDFLVGSFLLDRLDFRHQRSGAPGDDAVAFGELLSALPGILADNRLQMVNVVEVNVVQLFHVRRDVTRHGDIN